MRVCRWVRENVGHEGVSVEWGQIRLREQDCVNRLCGCAGGCEHKLGMKDCVLSEVRFDDVDRTARE